METLNGFLGRLGQLVSGLREQTLVTGHARQQDQRHGITHQTSVPNDPTHRPRWLMRR
jgi:hypothetical protein